MPPWLAQLIAQVFAECVKQILLNLPTVMAAIRQANTSTAVTAPPATPQQISAAQSAVQQAIASGKIPPLHP